MVGCSMGTKPPLVSVEGGDCIRMYCVEDLEPRLLRNPRGLYDKLGLNLKERRQLTNVGKARTVHM